MAYSSKTMGEIMYRGYRGGFQNCYHHREKAQVGLTLGGMSRRSSLKISSGVCQRQFDTPCKPLRGRRISTPPAHAAHLRGMRIEGCKDADSRMWGCGFLGAVGLQVFDSGFQICRLSDFQISRFSHFQTFRFSDFHISIFVRFADFRMRLRGPASRFSDFRI